MPETGLLFWNQHMTNTLITSINCTLALKQHRKNKNYERYMVAKNIVVQRYYRECSKIPKPLNLKSASLIQFQLVQVKGALLTSNKCIFTIAMQ